MSNFQHHKAVLQVQHFTSFFVCIWPTANRFSFSYFKAHYSRLLLKCDGTCTETTFRLSPKRTSPFKLAGASVQSTAGNRGVRISVSNAGYTMFRGSVRVLATHSIRQFPLHFPSRASPCAIRFQLDSTTLMLHWSLFLYTLLLISVL